MESILNRDSAPRIVRFFDICFKQGVLDAYKYSDDIGAKEFLLNHKEKWDFGVLGEPDDFDWQMWRFTLYHWARQHRMKEFSDNYIFKIVRKNYLWYLLPFCMRFYLLGIEEWLEYPNPTPIQWFKLEPRTHWKPTDNATLRKISTNDFISYLQQFTYEYRRCGIEPKTMSVATMDGYCTAIFDLTRRYKFGRKK